ncbi:PIG-L family deacetylase [Cohnella pontilimi]|uniref:PIG-L family deacetylase n=1 Tax=Cohnella pontilimi TaxID=2564100 RepID=A0A4U0FF41_9BACL|nr:PIG-L family deacetylase [Cohnella pontilimi]TJY41962.1 PIG-L family deacetylase [Cohnella pontilimi]
MKKVLVIAPHPDDETLGCGGTLLKHIESGDEVYWLIVTGIDVNSGYTSERVAERDREIAEVARLYPFRRTFSLHKPTTKLDELPFGELVQDMAEVFRAVEPDTVYVPYRGDVHSDHKYVFDAAISCSKWFRYPFVRKVLAYETLSETEFGLNPDANGFRPNVYVNISDFMDRKWSIMQTFDSEIAEFPFPRSKVSMEALARYRGSAAGVHAAEAFMLLKEVIQ